VTDLVLPEIDTPPQAPVAGSEPQEPFVPESAPGTPLPEDRAITDDAPAGSGVVDAGDVVPPAAPGQKVSKSANQKRIDELTREKYDLQRKLEVREEVRRQIGTSSNGAPPADQPRPAPVVEAPKEPQRKDFPNVDDYYDARADYRADMRMYNTFKNASEIAQQQESVRGQQQNVTRVLTAVAGVQNDLTVQLQKGNERFPDFNEVVSAATDELPLNVQVAMHQSGDPVGVSYYLAKHQEVIPRLHQLRPMELGAALGRIASAMKGNAAVASASNFQSAAPPPGRPAGGRGGNPMTYREDFSPEEHLQWERAAGISR
jgi:hypothetical protein